MSNASVDDPEIRGLQRKATAVAIRLLLVVGLAWWCFLIFEPFLMPVVWGIVLAVALSPAFRWIESLLGGRRKLAGTLFILVGVVALIVPAVLTSDSFFDGLRWLRAQEAKDVVEVPPPPADVAEWPLIGDRIHAVWMQASDNLETTLEQFRPQVKSFVTRLLSTLAGFGVAFVLTVVAVILAGVFLMHAERGGALARTIGARLGGARGEAAIDLATKTIRSVAYGVVGVAAVQAALAAIGLVLAGVPAAGLLAAVVLILAVAQLPPLLVMGPAILYVVATGDSVLTQVLFTIWALIVSFSDAFLKPMFLGRGVEVPMLVILIGAIGGLMRAGVVGLFVGAVVLSIGYTMFTNWTKEVDI